MNRNDYYRRLAPLEPMASNGICQKEMIGCSTQSNFPIRIEKFYKDQQKYAFSFQMMAYISRLALLRRVIRENPNAIIITERSVFTDKEVFAKMLYDEGKIEEW